MKELPFLTRSTTFRSSEQAFRNHCDYACAVHRGPRNTMWRRLIRFFLGPRDTFRGPG